MRDTLVFLGSALRESAALAAEALVGSQPLPRDAASVSAGWLTEALQERFPGVRVSAVEPLRRHSGTTDRVCVRAAYDQPGAGEPPPATLFVKSPPPDAPTRLFINLTRLPTHEVRFYQQIAPALSIERPRAYHAQVTGAGQRFALVLEDLGARNARLFEVADELTGEEARQVVVELARLHATFWDSPRLQTDLAWLRAPGKVAWSLAAVERLLPSLALSTALKRHGNLVPPEIRAVARRIVGLRRPLELAWGREPLTVIHGDAHASNLYSVDGRIGLLDWQLVQCGQGMRDLAYFLTTSLPTDLRRAVEKDLVALYLSTLAGLGVANAPAFDEAWMQYRLHALYAWEATMFTAAAAGLQPAANALGGFERASTALVDLKSVEALDALLWN